MTGTLTALSCSQCGTAAPDAPRELVRWQAGVLALRSELEAPADMLLLCPDCVAEQREHAFEEGEGD